MVPRFERRVKAYAAEVSALAITFILVSLGIEKIYLKVLILVLVFLMASIIPVVISKGQTFGKRIQEIKVVKLDGTEANIFILILREMFKIAASILTYGIYTVIAFFMMSEKEVSRTIHDYIFKTKVIDLRKPKVRNKNDEHMLGKPESMKKRGL